MAYLYESKKKPPITKMLDEPWPVFNSNLHRFSEDELSKMLDLEVANKQRKSYAVRIHARLAALRTERERKAIEDKLNKRK